PEAGPAERGVVHAWRLRAWVGYAGVRPCGFGTDLTTAAIRNDKPASAIGIGAMVSDPQGRSGSTGRGLCVEPIHRLRPQRGAQLGAEEAEVADVPDAAGVGQADAPGGALGAA